MRIIWEICLMQEDIKMDERIIRLIIALGKFSAQPRQYRIMEGLNTSETGIFWAMTQIVAEKPGTELFGLS